MTNLNQMTDAELAEHYNRTHDVAKFEGCEVVVPPGTTKTRNLTISIRLSSTEMADLETQAAVAGLPLTTYIRTTALAAKEPPVDRNAVLELLARLRSKVEPTEGLRPVRKASVKGRAERKRVTSPRVTSHKAGTGSTQRSATKSTGRKSDYGLASKTPAKRQPKS